MARPQRAAFVKARTDLTWNLWRWTCCPSETELLDRQRALQMEADQVAQDLMLMELAQPLGNPVLVGSAALGLMVWRDLDVTVVCRGLD